MSTIRIPATVPHPAVDCSDLFIAFQGLRCDKDVVIDILAHRSLDQRLLIEKLHKDLFGEALMERIKSKLHFNFKKVTMLWMSDRARRDALILMDIFRRSHTLFSSWKERRRALVEMLCLQSSEDLRLLDERYYSFDRTLQEDVLASTEGFARKLFARLVATSSSQTCSDEGESGIGVDRRASEGAQALHEATEGCRVDCVNEATIFEMLTTKSRLELLAIFNAYKDAHGRDVYKAIRKGAVHDSQATIREILKFISNPPRFFATTLYRSMKGPGTDDKTLIRVVVTRAEVDMQQIKSEFLRKYKVSLDNTISSDTSGSYRRFLLGLVGGNGSNRDGFLSRLL